MAFQILDQLQALGYLTYTLDPETRLLTYRITDWVMEYTGKECMDGAVYATPGHGFLCMPRDITERLAEKNYEFDEADAWLDLWCHTVFRDYGNAFSFLSPVIQYGKYGSMLTLETLGKRWGWEKTKVWRFFRKYPTYFHLYRLPNSYGCVIYNHFYPSCDKINMRDAIEYGDRLLMMYNGRIVVDVSGEEKKKLTVEQLLNMFSQASGSDEVDDKLVLS